jgi:Raf kinase inhibitor-like YbhB/YbcL family protein
VGILVFGIAIVLGFIAGSLIPLVSGGPRVTRYAPIPEGVLVFNLTSPVIGDDGSIPKDYTCDGINISPPLLWEGQPNGTVAYALIMEDIDAPGGVFTHWIIYNIPGVFDSLDPGIPRLGFVAGVGLQGFNDFNDVGYLGPCPPPGSPHRYRFVLYALNEALPLREGASRDEFLAALEGRVIGAAELIVTYYREPG